MDHLVKKLAQTRDDIEQRKAAIKLLESQLEDNEIYKQIKWAKEGLKNVQDIEASEKKSLSETAVEKFDGNKKPHPAISIGEYTVVEFDDQEMKEWAIEHNHPALLNLNKRAATSVAKGATAPKFVTATTEVRASIATDLSDYL